tara:strand:+ start:1501 stop:1830 length:330 start_codon:yes stop_codon:yes gene_type:complete
MSFYNTTHETESVLKESHRKTNSQESRILNYFLMSGEPLSPSMILKQMGLNCPITSIRRALTDLTLDNKLVKTDDYCIGTYGKREHLWRLKTEDDFINPDQFSLFGGSK